jgi:hypothetical protein
MDAARKCCPEPRALAHDGTCCFALERLDVDGKCCSEKDLDGCGVCRGRGLFVDSLGNCCPTTSQDADGACCLSSVDSCGVLLCSCCSRIVSTQAPFLGSVATPFI